MCMVDRKIKSRVMLLLLTFAPLAALAATGGDTNISITAEQKSIIDLFKWVIGIALAGQFFWIRKYMTDNEKKHEGHKEALASNKEGNRDTHREQWQAISNLATALARLDGEHTMATHRRSEDPVGNNVQHTRQTREAAG
jgi:hypothetical protein